MIALQHVIISHRFSAADCQLHHFELRQFLQQTADAYFNPAFNSGALHVLSLIHI